MSLTISGVEYGPYPTNIEVRRYTWDGRVSVRMKPTSKQLNAKKRRWQFLIEKSHNSLMATPMTGEMLMQQVKVFEDAGIEIEPTLMERNRMAAKLNFAAANSQ